MFLQARKTGQVPGKAGKLKLTSDEKAFQAKRYHYSPKAVRELRMIAAALEEKVLKPSNLHGARWLPYVHCAIKVFQKDNITVCQAVESQEACFWDITSMKMMMGPQMAKVHQAVQESGEYNGVKLQNVTQSILESERTVVIDSIITHLEERLEDLQQGGTIAKFRALDPSSWPVCDRADPVAREQFMQTGADEFRALATFYEELLGKADIMVDNVIAEYNQYKIYAQGRASVPMRELFMKILNSGVNIKKE
ncbi:hypothetical protein SKAU_G00209960 [Synaphobranchus kaupii]|uniref:Uncharacterized protein n=1 Tax=Synaphobranchus kaupii TaxID=118154 RepID=A0A9Q1F8Q3_SYNKA|nr:hypothetical protein SKAU_G00209960 [Synaphobranchus kaupii]